MSGKKIILMILLCILLLASVVLGLIWGLKHYVMVDFVFYPSDAEVLDLREKSVSVDHYRKLSFLLPECEIRWDVPFQETAYPNDVTQITVTTLSEADLEALAFLPNLKVVHAEQCREYALLTRMQKENPHLQVEYTVQFSDGTSYPKDTETLTIRSITGEDASLLEYIPNLKRITVDGGGDLAGLEEFREAAGNLGLEFCILIGEKMISDKEQTVELSGLKEEELPLLELLTGMQTLHIQNPEIAPESLLALRETYPNAKITWEVEFAGLSFADGVEEVDLSAAVIEDLAEVEKGMSYLPAAEKLILGLCGIDNPDWGASRTKNLAICEIENEDLAAYRDRVRGQYKVVWTVRLGPSIALRTDADNFMPNHYGVGRLFNDYAYNLRYCEDMVCLDVGHMTLTDISFVEFMPNLKYLILAWTEVQYIEPIRSCKNLVFLELDNSCIRDYSPLVDCTALEDLNIGKTFCDITPVLEMTWLKNLYMIFGSGGDAWRASQALPDTHVVATGNATVGGGWRRLPNYYDMRDCLGVPYMN